MKRDIINTRHSLWSTTRSIDTLIIPASYIVYIDGSTIKALNGTTGIVDYSGEDASSVIQCAIDAVGTGEKIFINKGIYTLSSKLSIKDINIEGVGPATILKAGINLNDVVIEVYNAPPGKYGHYNGRIAHLKIEGNKENQSDETGKCHGLVLANTGYYILEDLYFTNVKHYALKILFSFWTDIRDIYIDSLCNNGIKVGEYSSGKYNGDINGDLVSNENVFINIKSAPSGVGITIESGANNIFINCDNTGCITGVLLKPGDEIEGYPAGLVENTTFINHWFETCTIGIQTALSDGFIQRTVGDIYLINPRWAAGNTTRLVNGTDSNIYYGTGIQNGMRNSGVATISDGGTIAHGITAATPTNAIIIGSVANEIVAVTALDDKNITVAIKKRVDGTAGTKQKIYWEADV